MGTMHIEIDEVIKARATQTLADSGLSLTGAISFFIQELAEGRMLPSDYEPNDETARVLAQVNRREEIFPMEGSVHDFLRQATEDA